METRSRVDGQPGTSFKILDNFHKLEVWSKIEILVKNRNVGQNRNFWSKIEILVKNRSFSQKFKFGQKIKFWSEIEILVK